MTDIRVFTDGSCVRNGKPDAVGGYGVYFDDPVYKDLYYKEFYRYLLPHNSNGLVTNNRAELLAVLAALWSLHRDVRDVQIYVDSEYVKLMLEKYCFVDRKIPDSAKNIDLLNIIAALYRMHYHAVRRTVTVFHVTAHTNGTDPITRGNRRADELAALGRNQALRMIAERGKVEKQAIRFARRFDK